MRILLKKGTRYLTMYYIKRRKSNKCIVGWFSNKMLLQTLFPEINTENSDIHFTYYSNGRYHISLKYTDELGDTIERRIYYDKITVKNKTKKTTEEFPIEGESVFCGHLMPGYQLPEFSDTNLFFQTILSGGDLSGNWVDKWFDESQEISIEPRENDIIVDIDQGRNYQINTSSLIMGSDFIEPPITNPNFTFDKIIFKEDKTASPYIKLQVIFHLNKPNEEKNVV